MSNQKILYITTEMSPYEEGTKMAGIVNKMAIKMHQNGNDVRVFMPRFGFISERKFQLHEVIRLSGMNLIIDETDHPLIIKVASIPVSRLQVYFIDNEDYFIRRQAMTEDENGDEYADNGERAIFFARGVLETVKKLRWTPDIVQCQGWMSAVVPFYIKTAYRDDPSFANTKVITSLFHNQFKSSLGDKFKRCVEFGNAKADLLKPYDENFNFIELGKMAIDYSDAVVEAGENVNQDLLEYAKNSNRPLMRYPKGTDYAADYKDFYNKLLEVE